MDPAFGATIVNLVPAEAVEHPAFAAGHVNRLAAAGEFDSWIGDDRHVNPKMSPPVVMGVHMLGHLRLGAEAHQPAATPYPTKLGHQLHDVGAALEIFGWAHRPFESIGRLAVYRDETDRLIAR